MPCMYPYVEFEIVSPIQTDGFLKKLKKEKYYSNGIKCHKQHWDDHGCWIQLNLRLLLLLRIFDIHLFSMVWLNWIDFGDASCHCVSFVPIQLYSSSSHFHRIALAAAIVVLVVMIVYVDNWSNRSWGVEKTKMNQIHN